jgi:uncharacterized protein (DUF952 family)
MSNDGSANAVVYKVLRLEEWRLLQRSGRYAGSPDDQRDGFIHLSTWAQLSGTLDRHFSRADDRQLVVAVIGAGPLGDALVWELSRGGALFPHLYGELTLKMISDTFRLSRVVGGTYVLPAEPAP